MKKSFISASLFLTAAFVATNTLSAVYALPNGFNPNRGSNRPTSAMERQEQEKSEASPEAKPSDTMHRPMACQEVKTKLPERALILTMRKEVHLKVYANLKVNLKRRMMARNMSDAAITEALAGMDKLITKFSTDVDAEVAKMKAAATLDCTSPTALTDYRDALKVLENAVKEDVKAIINYYRATVKTMSGTTGAQPTTAPTSTQ